MKPAGLYAGFLKFDGRAAGRFFFSPKKNCINKEFILSALLI